MKKRGRFALLFVLISIGTAAGARERGADPARILEQVGVSKGICVVVGGSDAQVPVEIAQASELLVYVQSADPSEVESVRKTADAAGLLGSRVYVELGNLSSLHLATNLADGLVTIGDDVRNATPRAEILRVIHPGAKALVGKAVITKPRPVGADDWSHPYHGPDNNPQSNDRLATAPYMTQFLTEPWYVPMPQVTVASGGRLFKAFGHIALKRREWQWLNTLVAICLYTHLTLPTTPYV